MKSQAIALREIEATFNSSLGHLDGYTSKMEIQIRTMQMSNAANLKNRTEMGRMVQTLKSTENGYAKIGTVVGAFANETFKGAGSLRHMFSAVSSYISENLADESHPAHKKLTLEEYQNSPYFREDLEWDEGLTSMSAMLKAENRDRRMRNDIIINNASGGHKALGMGISVI